MDPQAAPRVAAACAAPLRLLEIWVLNWVLGMGTGGVQDLVLRVQKSGFGILGSGFWI